VRVRLLSLFVALAFPECDPYVVPERVYLNTGFLARDPYLSGDLPDPGQAEKIAREDAEARRLVAAAEKESSSVCESCSRPGRARDGSWIKTLCDDCHGHA